MHGKQNLSRRTRARRQPASADIHAVKSQILRVVGHELRTPINAIVGFAELLATDQNMDAPRRNEYCQTILSSAQHLQSLIHDLLDAARLEGGTLELSEQPVAAAELVQVAIAANQRIASDGDVTIIARLADHITLAVDPARLRQAISNLITNAVKFSRPGSFVNIEMQRGPDGSFLLAIKDAGIGISSADIARVFDPFVQADGGPTRRYGGMGLGLSNARAIVRLHGGDVRLESAEGAGTTVQLMLPAARVTWNSVGFPGTGHANVA